MACTPTSETVPSINKAAALLRLIWALLWSACFILLLFFYKQTDGLRGPFPDGQYIFFVLALVASSVILIKHFQDILQQSGKMFAVVLGFMAIILGLSAVTGLQPYAGVRLLLIIALTTLPFILLGLYSAAMPYQLAVQPVVAVPLFCVISACILQLTGPFQVFGLIIDNHIFDISIDRWAFWFNEANNFAWVLATGISALLYFLGRSSSVKFFVSEFALLVLFLFVFWKTNSRGVAIWVVWALGMYCCLWVSAYINKRQLKKLLFGSLALFGIVAVIIYLNADHLFRFLRLDQSDLTTGRMQIWRVIIDEVQKYPLLGYGINATETIVDAADLKQEGPWPVLKGPLNLFIGILGEAGTLGLIALLWLLFGALWQCLKVIYYRFDSRDEAFYFAFFLFTTLIGMAIQQNGEWQVLRVTPFNYLFFFLTTAAWSLQQNVSKADIIEN